MLQLLKTRSGLLLSQLLGKVNRVIAEVRKGKEKHPSPVPDGLEAKPERLRGVDIAKNEAEEMYF